MCKLKYILVIISVSFFSLINVHALYDNYDFYVDDFNIIIDVNKDNSFDITEEIRVYFNQSKHGIYRNIPLRNTVSRLDGTKTKNFAKISNIEVNNSYTTNINDGYYYLQIGDASTLVSGYQEYVIKYNYNIGKDPLKDKDEFYFNIIGNEWDSVITYVTFTINMPEEFDSSLLGFSNGPVNSTTNDVVYTVSKNTIKGSLSTPLYKGDSLTIRLELPEGYFSEAKSFYGVNNIIAIIIPIASVLIAWLIYYIRKRNVKIVDAIEFYPPDDYNSLEIAFLYNGAVDNKDIISLLVYLADKKYLKIEEKTSKSLNTSYSTTEIIKLRDYDGNKYEESIFMESLFKSGNKILLDDVGDELYKTIYDIKNKMNSKTNKQTIYLESNKKYKVLYIFMAILAFYISSILNSLYYYTLEMIVIDTIAILFFAVVLYLMLISKTSKTLKVIISLLVIVFAIIFLMVDKYKYMYGNLIIFSSVLSIICYVIVICFASVFNFRTEFGNKIYGRILGFKKFLETAEKDKLEDLTEKNPEYFYDILPYAYVLGVSDKWIKNFEGIVLSAPSWYDGEDIFNIVSFNSKINSTINYVSSSSSFDGGSSVGSSGGGSSGGGSGGGGGGSW